MTGKPGKPIDWNTQDGSRMRTAFLLRTTC